MALSFISYFLFLIPLLNPDNYNEANARVRALEGQGTIASNNNNEVGPIGQVSNDYYGPPPPPQKQQQQQTGASVSSGLPPQAPLSSSSGLPMGAPHHQHHRPARGLPIHMTRVNEGMMMMSQTLPRPARVGSPFIHDYSRPASGDGSLAASASAAPGGKPTATTSSMFHHHQVNSINPTQAQEADAMRPPQASPKPSSSSSFRDFNAKPRPFLRS